MDRFGNCVKENPRNEINSKLINNHFFYNTSLSPVLDVDILSKLQGITEKGNPRYCLPLGTVPSPQRP